MASKKKKNTKPTNKNKQSKAQKNAKNSTAKNSTKTSNLNSAKENETKKPAQKKNDTAQQVAIIIAVLLIPTAIIAYNYAVQPKDKTDLEEVTVEELTPDTTVEEVEVTENSDDKPDVVAIKKEVEITIKKPEQINADTENAEEEKNETPEEEAKEMNEKNMEENTENTEEATEDTQIEEDDNERPLLKMAIIGGILKKIFDFFSNNKEQATQPENTETTVENTDNTNEENVEGTKDEATTQEETMDKENKEGMDKVNTLPNTSSKVNYIVKKGDNVYKISITVCKDESFYKKHMSNNFLRVGSKIEVECD